MSKEKIFWFFHERKDFYCVHAVTKEEALAKLGQADADEDEERYYDRSETAMDWDFYGSQKVNEWGEKEWEKEDS